MGLRHSSIRMRMLLLVLVPVLSLVGVYAFAVSLTFGAAVNLARAKADARQSTSSRNVLLALVDHALRLMTVTTGEVTSAR